MLTVRIRRVVRLLLALPLAPIAGAPAQSPPERTFDVRTFGTKGDSTSLDTDAINRAIAAAATAGGGTVYFGPGIYSSFSIHLKSHVTLYLERGATLFAEAPPSGPMLRATIPPSRRRPKSFRTMGIATGTTV